MSTQQLIDQAGSDGSALVRTAAAVGFPHDEALCAISNRLQVLAAELAIVEHMNASLRELNDALDAKLAELERQAVAIPDDVVQAAKRMQAGHYAGPLAWAVKVIDWVADYKPQAEPKS